jgi:hypothetical protein
MATVCGLHAQDSANVIPFQGQLANQAGQPLSPTNAVTLVFRLYQVPVGGVAIWEESQPNISVNAGRFSVLLGSRTLLPAQTYFNSTLYLGITVDDGNPATADVELRPRQALVPVISASYAKNAGKLNGYDWSALFGTNNPVDGSLLPSKIASNSITAAQIASGTISSNQIAPQTINASLIASGTITSNQIGTAMVDLSNLAQRTAESLNPAGAIQAFGGANTPAGWLMCDGSAVSSGQYPRLYTAISTNWGAGIQASTNNFNLPDLRGLFLRGVNGVRTNFTQTGMNFVDADVLSRTNGLAGGNGGNSVGSLQFDDFRSHIHDQSAGTYGAGNAGQGRYADGPATLSDSGLKTTPAGGNETRPKNAYVNYIIKY